MNKMLSIILAMSSIVILECNSLEKANFHPSTNALERMQLGNNRFAHHHMRHPDQSATRIKETSTAQHPYAVVLTCSDSRVSPEIIFDEGIGDLFVIRNAGNLAEQEDVLASVEYAIEHLGIRTVVVMGHEQCGAIKAMLEEANHSEAKHLEAIIKQLKDEPEEQQAMQSGEAGEQLVHQCVIANVQHGVKVLKEQALQIKNHNLDSTLSIVGAVYDIQTGRVQFL